MNPAADISEGFRSLLQRAVDELDQQAQAELRVTLLGHLLDWGTDLGRDLEPDPAGGAS